MNFHDVVRHLVTNGPWATDTDRDDALKAVDEHEKANTPAPAPAAYAAPVAAPQTVVMPQGGPIG